MGLNERFTAWYDRQPMEYLFLLGVAPLILIAVVLILVALIFG